MIKMSSSTRIDLAGGTLDCWPLWAMVGPCVTLNMSMPIKTYCELESSDKIEINVFGETHEFKNVESLLQTENSALTLLQQAVSYYKIEGGFKISMSSDSPVGAGLGGSSSLLITLLKAFAEHLGLKWTLQHIVEVAHNLEAKVLKAPTGIQDYIPAFIEGVGAIHFSDDGWAHEVLNINPDQLLKNIVIVYTGRSHHSGINNWDVIRRTVEGDKQALEALNELAVTSQQMHKVLKEQNFKKLPGLFMQETKARIKLSDTFISPEIKELNELVDGKQILASKICGAGGGGCVFLWCADNEKQNVSKICTDKGFQVLST